MAEPRAVQHAGHAADHVMRQARELAQRPDHGVERVGDADDEGVRRVVADALAHGFHDLEVDAQKVVAAHPRLARDTGGDDAHIRAGDVGVVVGALQLGVELFRRAAFGDVERLALRDALGDVEQDDIAQFLQRGEMGERAPDLPRADERDLGSGHGNWSFVPHCCWQKGVAPPRAPRKVPLRGGKPQRQGPDVREARLRALLRPVRNAVPRPPDR
jgi:hypothetical protein